MGVYIAIIIYKRMSDNFVTMYLIYSMNLDGYTIIEYLGAGATSEVYSAKRLKDDKNVALKLFLPLFTNDPEAISRIQEEAKALRALNDPNIVKLYSQIKINGQFGLELELIEGQDLRKRMAEPNSTFLEADVWLLVQVARGLAAAHELGILHRDLKPENILISNNGTVKLTDFGLSKCVERLTMTRVGLLVGSLGYMPPEIVDGQKATMASDIFSFGAIAYELLSGRPPFEADTPQALIKCIVDYNIVSLKKLCPQLPTRICNVIDKCLEKYPNKRPEGILSVEAELTNYLIQSGLLKDAKELLKKNGNPSHLAMALKAKHSFLKKQARKILSEVEIDRQKTIDLINEIQNLFPEETLALELLSHVNQKNNKYNSIIKKIRLASLAVSVFAMIGLGIYFFTAQSSYQPKEMPFVVENTKRKNEKKLQKLEKGIVNVDAKHTDKTSKQGNKKADFPKVRSMPKYGHVEFLVDPSVKVFVDTKLVPQDQIHSYKLKAGTYALKLSKEGFLPIEGQFHVKPNKLTTIKANGE